jgi:RNA polymerase sigma-70 factor (ECF subfamily)
MNPNGQDKRKWFQQTVIGLESPLLKYTMKIINRLAPSEEVVQDSFLKLWQQEFPGQFEHYPKAWLYKVCRNLAIDYLRKEKKCDLDENLEDILSTPCLNEALLDASHILKEINKLSPSEQEVLILKFNDDLSYKEIAELTGFSVSNVGAKIHNALEKIRSVVLAELNELAPTKTKE